MATRNYEAVPTVKATAAALKSLMARNLVEVLGIYSNRDDVEIRWVKSRPVINFLEIEGGGKDSILTMQFSPFDQKLQSGWRSEKPNAKGKFTYCPTDDLVTYEVHTWDIGINADGNIVRIEDPDAKKPTASKSKKVGLPTA